MVQKIDPPAWDLAGPRDAFQDDLERARDEVSRLTAERDALTRESARWFDAAILATAEQVPRLASQHRTRRLRSLAQLFRVDRSVIAAGIADRAHSKGEWERAARFYLDALVSDPTAPGLWLQLGHSLKSAGKRPEAEFAYRRAAALRSE